VAEERVAYTSVEPPPNNGCQGCLERKNLRLHCPEHRQKKSCPWCAGRGFVVKYNVWIRCDHVY
jgi:hypothetical protein